MVRNTFEEKNRLLFFLKNTQYSLVYKVLKTILKEEILYMRKCSYSLAYKFASEFCLFCGYSIALI